MTQAEQKDGNSPAGVTPAARIGPYEVVAAIGAGGMGEVLRARDTKLGREVAIKVLPAAFAQDAERVARFRREAQILAALNHPNIAAIHGLEEGEGVLALVMELVEGEDLAQRLKRGAIPVDEAIAIAKQIAEALEEAHEKGIVHRDLKPANVKVTADGKVKVLDFGLAKAFAADPMASSGSHDLSQSPTLAGAGTMAGVILGTAAYMSPEQARGKAVDKRADIWAFGVVLFEMLTGRRLFEGETVSDTLASVLKTEPDWTTLPPDTARGTTLLLRRCLEKDPRQRLRDMGDVRFELQRPADAPSPASPPAAASSRPWPGVALAAALVLVALGGGFLAGRRAPAPERGVTRFEIALPAGLSVPIGNRSAITLAPDDSAIVFTVADAATHRLYVKKREQADALPIVGTENPRDAFFSPDGRWLGFFSNGQLRKVSLADGTLVDITASDDSSGATWAPDGTIVFAPGYSSGLSRVPADGGTPQPLTTRNAAAGEASHSWPQVLPDGDHVLYTIEHTGRPFDEASIGVVSIRSGATKVLLRGGAFARHSPSGHLVYARGGRLLAVPFDLGQLEASGEATTVVEGVSVEIGRGRALFAISRAGSLAFVPGPNNENARALSWVTRDGRRTPASALQRGFDDLGLSADSRRVLAQLTGSDDDIWLFDLARDVPTRLTFGNENRSPNWAPDGKRFVFSSDRDGPFNLYLGSADAGAGVERLTTSPQNQLIGGWSRDGRHITYTQEDPRTLGDVWVLPMEAEPTPRAIVQTPFDERVPVLSPDGRWLAFASDETGQSEVYIQAFPGPGARRQVSDHRGGDTTLRLPGTRLDRPLRWSHDGRELFYWSGDRLLSVAVHPGTELETGAARIVFELAGVSDYDVSADGRFLVVQELETRPLTRVIVALGGAADIGGNR
ncbi:MAG: protein kinase [Vicinamibacteria bacterium]|nr:protein kinase [Vicinamibacteria bacterium]